jgi:hypothetical protein
MPSCWRGRAWARPAGKNDRAAEAFVIAHVAPGAWADGTVVKYRQTLIALGARLGESAPQDGGCSRDPLEM